MSASSLKYKYIASEIQKQLMMHSVKGFEKNRSLGKNEDGVKIVRKTYKLYFTRECLAELML